MIPPVAHELKLMSIGFFVDDNKPLMWRGPMLHRALEQFLQDVHWGDLDILVVDMPPGTGDVSISLGQMLPRAEAVVVTTPQPLAQEVASRAAQMARTTKMQLLGVIENMTSEVFGSGGGERLAAELGVKLLGTIPLDSRIRAAADVGNSARRLRPRLRAGARDRRDRGGDRPQPQRRLHPHASACLLTERPTPGWARRFSRLSALGFSDEDSRVVAAHFLEAEDTGRAGHGLRRLEWLEGWSELDTAARPLRVLSEPGYERWNGNGAARLPHAERDRRGAARRPARAGADRRRRPDVPDRDARPLGTTPGRRRARRRAHRDLAAAARPSRRRPQADRDEPARDRDPLERRASRWSSTSRWRT